MGIMRFPPTIAALLLLAPLVLVGCASDGTPAQADAAAKLAADCERTPKDPVDKYITTAGRSVTLKLTEDAMKQLKAFTAQEVTPGNLTEVTKGGSFMDGLGVAMGVTADISCLARRAGTPTDAKGNPKAGDWPNWKVTVNSEGIPTFTSTTQG